MALLIVQSRPSVDEIGVLTLRITWVHIKMKPRKSPDEVASISCYIKSHPSVGREWRSVTRMLVAGTLDLVQNALTSCTADIRVAAYLTMKTTTSRLGSFPVTTFKKSQEMVPHQVSPAPRPCLPWLSALESPCSKEKLGWDEML